MSATSVEPVTVFRVGDTVRFHDPIHARYWFLDPEAVGEVVSIKGHVVTARFKGKHAFSTSFDLVTRAAP
jgi:hypothetical protein